LFTSEEVTSFGADFGFGEGRLGVLHDELRHPVLAAVVVDKVPRAEFAERDGSRSGNEFAGGIARRNKDTKGQAREVVAGEEAFGSKVAVRIKLGAFRATGRAMSLRNRFNWRLA
jgi:hypothetical protein